MKNSIFFVLLLLPVVAFVQEKPHTLFIKSNINIAPENSLYIDFDEPDFEVWSETENRFSYGLGYTYNLSESFGFGVQAEIEKIKFEDFYLGKAEGNRMVFGVHFCTTFPQKPVHGYLGGNFNIGKISSDDFDNDLKGFEYGVFLGPEYSISDIDIALLFHGQFGSYYSKKEAPESGLMLYPKLMLRIGYSF
jgi:hypothetical protein